MALILRTDGTQESKSPADGKTFTLKELQDVVGGYIERVVLPNKKEIYLNEEGKLKGLKENPRATTLAAFVLGPGDYIVGDVIVCDPGEVE